MIFYHSIRKGEKLYNQINGVSLTNDYYNRYWFQALDYLNNLKEEAIYHGHWIRILDTYDR